MKILLTSDWHLDAVTAGIPRINEFDAYLSVVRQAAVDHSVDVIAVLGDYFDPGKMNGPEMVSRILDAAWHLDGAAKWVMWIAGNHDVVETSMGWTTLSPLDRAVRAGFPGSPMTRHLVFECPQTVDCGAFAVMGLPYVARAAATPDDHVTAFRGAQFARNEGKPLIVLGHMMVPGAIQGSESREMARGRDMDLPMDHLADLEPALVANGHYHKAQTVKGPKGLRVVIPGSPHRFTFGERDDADKGFIIVEVPGA